MQIDLFQNSPIGDLQDIKGVDGRNGRQYVHSAYVAHPLGDEPELDGVTWRAVTRASRALAHLDQASRQVPDPQILRRPTLSREAQSTSALEGTFAPIDDVLAADSTETHDAALTEVLNYVFAADVAFDFVTEHRIITAGLLSGAHRQLVEGTASETRDAGRVRQCQVAIGSPDGTIESSRFVPMPPGPALDTALFDLLSWINLRTDRDPLIAAAMAHYQFETLHPFNDGNGRLGRLLIVLQLMVDGLLKEPLLSVSPWFEARRAQYQDELARVSETGEWDSWIRFFSAGVEASAVDTADRVNRMLDIRRDYVQRLQDSGSRSGVARDIVEVLIESPIVRVQTLADRFGKTSQGVEVAVKKLLSLGILRGPFGGSYRRFYIAEDIRRAIAQ
ncbi:Fic family protein [Mycobacteroides abscessus]|uniref:Fic family protein n=1 Tax=Mycobacteroides abscessus TaxID=36809 RepID=UPI000D3E8F79|nr:Fic/DOC family N-terminal domain-containing protein [Mycobacteroides abscessus]PVA20842.1 Fic family protein [Mycobacteroides abscessus]